MPEPYRFDDRLSSIRWTGSIDAHLIPGPEIDTEIFACAHQLVERPAGKHQVTT